MTSYNADKLKTKIQNQEELDFKMKYDLEDEAQSLQNNRGIDHGISTSGPNLVILAWMGHELSRGQFWTGNSGHTGVRTDGHTDAGNDNTRRPKPTSDKNYRMWHQQAGS